MKLYHILITLLIVTSTAHAAEPNPEPDFKSASLMVATSDTPTLETIFVKPALSALAAAKTAGRDKVFGNGFLAEDGAGRTWRFTCLHCADHWSKSVFGIDIAAFPAIGETAKAPLVGAYREGRDVTVASWIPTAEGQPVWTVMTARSRAIPGYRKDEIKESPYGKAFPNVDPERLRIVEVSSFTDDPELVAGVSGSPVYQDGKVVGVLVASNASPSLISYGLYFEVFVSTTPVPDKK